MTVVKPKLLFSYFKKKEILKKGDRTMLHPIMIKTIQYVSFCG